MLSSLLNNSSPASLQFASLTLAVSILVILPISIPEVFGNALEIVFVTVALHMMSLTGLVKVILPFSTRVVSDAPISIDLSALADPASSDRANTVAIATVSTFKRNIRVPFLYIETSAQENSFPLRKRGIRSASPALR